MGKLKNPKPMSNPYSFSLIKSSNPHDKSAEILNLSLKDFLLHELNYCGEGSSKFECLGGVFELRWEIPDNID